MILHLIKGKTVCLLKEEEANSMKKIFKMNILYHKELCKRDCEKAIAENEELKRLG